jgi:3-methyladenine DNA glycosylase AlkC
MEENFALKDMFNPDSVGAFARAITDVYADFASKRFSDDVFDQEWPDLALKDRVRKLTIALGNQLPENYLAALKILQDAIPLLKDQGFEKMVFPDYIEVFGLDDWDASIQALEFITQHVSAEFAIRPFIVRYPDQTMQQLHQWSNHPHPGVRRLASEGCRPRLPWGLRLKDLVADPTPILPILENLKDDPREEIRRSVANNLNDISKDHPELVVNTVSNWQDPENPKRSQLIKHALRSLLKSGHPGALDLMGFPADPEIKVENISLKPDQIHLGQDTNFSFEILSTGKEEQRLMIDYLVYFLKANGSHSPKVFKLSQKSIQPGERIRITKKHSIRPITTRKYYPGPQHFQPQVNGKQFPKIQLILKA